MSIGTQTIFLRLFVNFAAVKGLSPLAGTVGRVSRQAADFPGSELRR
jgi:hypothetical protein